MSGSEGRNARPSMQVVARTRHADAYWKGQGADRTMLSKALQRLPEIGCEVARRLDLRHRDRGLLRHQQMERQRCERPRWHNDQVPLALDQTFDRPDERAIKLMR